MKTTLFEFKNRKDQTLRGIFTPKSETATEIILMAGGFERSATTEKKFKAIADKSKIDCLRFDYTGVGLSDGDFSEMTITGMSDDLKKAIEKLQQKGYQKINLVVHSLSACVAACLMKEISFEKIIFLSPALNQAALMRYWFALSVAKKKGLPENTVTWQNYQDYFSEDEFLVDCRRSDKMTKQNHVPRNYFLENQVIDYSGKISEPEQILCIMGDKDDKVPKKSLNEKFTNVILVSNGDHDLERPDMISEWLSKAIEFIEK